MNKIKIMVILLPVLIFMPWACRYNDDLWNRASDKIDSVAPDVSYFEPGDGGGITVALSIRFNDNMMHSTLNNSTITIDDGSGVVPGSWSYDLVDVTGGQQTIARFLPTTGYNGTTSGNTFIRNTSYDITISTDARDYYGNYLAAEWSGSFTTAAGLELEDSDVDTTTNPANHRITLVFNDPPATGWSLTVTGTYNAGADTLNQVYTPASGEVSWSTASRFVYINTGVAFDSGSDITVDGFTAFSAEVDGEALVPPGLTETIPVP